MDQNHLFSLVEHACLGLPLLCWSQPSKTAINFLNGNLICAMLFLLDSLPATFLLFLWCSTPGLAKFHPNFMSSLMTGSLASFFWVLLTPLLPSNGKKCLPHLAFNTPLMKMTIFDFPLNGPLMCLIIIVTPFAMAGSLQLLALEGDNSSPLCNDWLTPVACLRGRQLQSHQSHCHHSGQ